MSASKSSPLKLLALAEIERAAFDQRQADLRRTAAIELGEALLIAGIRIEKPDELVALAKAGQAVGFKAALAAVRGLPDAAASAGRS